MPKDCCENMEKEIVSLHTLIFLFENLVVHMLISPVTLLHNLFIIVFFSLFLRVWPGWIENKIMFMRL